MKVFSSKLSLCWLWGLAIILLFGACQIDKIKDDLSPDTLAEIQNKIGDDIPFEGVCRFEIGVLVLDSETCLPLEEAEIEVVLDNGSKKDLLTDMDGASSFSTLFDSSLDSLEIYIGKEDYTQSRFIIRAEDYFDVDACRGNTCYFTGVDFFLAPQQPKQKITKGWGEWNILEEIKLLEDGEEGENIDVTYHINIPENTVIDPLDMVYSPLDIRQYFCGDVPEEPIVAVFEGKPAPFNFLFPLELSFTPPRDLPSDAILNCYFFDEETNSWVKDENAFVDYDQKKVHVNIARLACIHMITYTEPYLDGDRSTIEIVEDEMNLGDDILDSYEIGNCDCNMMKVDTVSTVFERDRRMETLRFPNEEISEKEMEIFLNDLRRLYCIPAKTSADLAYDYDNIFGSDLSLTTKVKMQLSPFFLQECDNYEIFVTEKKRMIKGSYNDFYFEYEAVIRTDFRKIKINCPTTSGCHQGCGD